MAAVALDVTAPLMMALGEDAVCLEGETQASHRIKIMAGSSCHLEADDRFTLVLNQDSFPEIDRAIVCGYRLPAGAPSDDEEVLSKHQP